MERTIITLTQHELSKTALPGWSFQIMRATADYEVPAGPTPSAEAQQVEDLKRQNSGNACVHY